MNQYPDQARYRNNVTYRNENTQPYPFPQPGEYLQPNSNNNNFPPRPAKYFGKEDIFDFGKYRDMSCYQIANNGDFKYLKWLTTNKNSGGFKLSEKTISHIANSLNLQPHKGMKWQRNDTADSYWYEFTTNNGQIIKSPVIQKSAVILNNQPQ